MLGQALCREASRHGYEAVGIAHSGCDCTIDITNDIQLVECIANIRPEIIVNAAAMTSLAECESDPGRAYRVNARAGGVLAEICRSQGAYLVQVSTDHYFTGDGAAQHAETAPVRLVNEYARTKFAGEAFARTCPGALVVRTNIVGFRGRGTPTFAEWAIGALQSGAPVRVFDDFFTSSIDVGSFAKAIFHILPARVSGILNLASREVASKKTFISLLAAELGLGHVPLLVGSVAGLADAQRAESLGLAVAKAEGLLGYELPTTREVIQAVVREYQGRIGV